MHCETTRNTSSTYLTSYEMLTKLYSEGWIQSIGVSNFDMPLLQTLSSLVDIRPHVVQNWAELGNHLDIEVRNFCDKEGVAYQPYATVRNMRNWSRQLHAKVRRLARKYNTSEHAISLRFFVQSGAVVIPRSTSAQHLYENVQVSQWRLDEEDMDDLLALSTH